jgi:hypothetical protein
MGFARDAVLAAHIAAGSAGLILGAVALLFEGAPTYRSRAGAAYVWAVTAVAASAVALVALDEWELWWILPLAVLACILAIAGYLAPGRRRAGWIRLYAHGQGGAYIALVTALLVVSLSGAAAGAAWIVPTVIGVALIERRVARIKESNRELNGGHDDPKHISSAEGMWARSRADREEEMMTSHDETPTASDVTPRDFRAQATRAPVGCATRAASGRRG